MALSDNLVAYYSMETTGGVDATGRGNDASTLHGTPTSVAGKVGNCVQFASASNQWINCSADTADTSMGDIDCTFAVWINMDTFAGSSRCILSKWTGGTTANQEYSLYYETTADRFRFGVDGFSKTVDASSFGSPSTSTWYFIVARHNAAADTITICVNDGTVNSTATAGVFPVDRTNAFAIANFRSDAASGQFNGRIDEVAIWKRALSAAEITDLYNAGSGRNYAYVSAAAAAQTHRLLTMTGIG